MGKTVQFDARGLKCPGPTLKMGGLVMKKEVESGDTLVVTADCPTFPADVKEWCKNRNKVLVRLREEKGLKIAEIRI